MLNLPKVDGHIIHCWNELHAILMLPLLERVRCHVKSSKSGRQYHPLLDWITCHVKSSTFWRPYHPFLEWITCHVKSSKSGWPYHTLLEWITCHVKSSTFGVFKTSTFGMFVHIPCTIERESGIYHPKMDVLSLWLQHHHILDVL